MTREQQLEAALAWALKHGAKPTTTRAYSWDDGCYTPEMPTWRSAGCDCCSDAIEPPEEIAGVLAEIRAKAEL